MAAKLFTTIAIQSQNCARSVSSRFLSKKAVLLMVANRFCKLELVCQGFGGREGVAGPGALNGSATDKIRDIAVPKIHVQFVKLFCMALKSEDLVCSECFVFFEEMINSNHYVQLFLSLFIRKLTEEEKNVQLLYVE